jgi:predicted small secreted protein
MKKSSYLLIVGIGIACAAVVTLTVAERRISRTDYGDHSQ